ncbi:hypothetical protein BC833DRAFT_613722 [Globomyces pollinis-pini]|nr:hypothetical protein BC833DRAFT_613722 [Globomyces pollinis-pini]
MSIFLSKSTVKKNIPRLIMCFDLNNEVHIMHNMKGYQPHKDLHLSAKLHIFNQMRSTS